MGFAQANQPSSLLAGTSSRRLEVMCPGPAVYVRAGLGSLELLRASTLPGLAGAESRMAEGFASPFWKPLTGASPSKSRPCAVSGVHKALCSHASCTDGCASQWLPIALRLFASFEGRVFQAQLCWRWGPWLAGTTLLHICNPLGTLAGGPVRHVTDLCEEAIPPQILLKATSQWVLFLSDLRTVPSFRRTGGVTLPLHSRPDWCSLMLESACLHETQCDSDVSCACCHACCSAVGRLRVGSSPFQSYPQLLTVTQSLIKPKVLPNRHFLVLCEAMSQWKSRCTLQRQGTRPGKRQREAQKKERERTAMQMHDKPEVPVTPPSRKAGLDKPEAHGTPLSRKTELAFASAWPTPYIEASSSIGSAWASPIPLREPVEPCVAGESLEVKTEPASGSGIRTLPLTAIPQSAKEEPIDAQLAGTPIAASQIAKDNSGRVDGSSDTEASTTSTRGAQVAGITEAVKIGPAAAEEAAPVTAVMTQATSNEAGSREGPMEASSMSSDRQFRGIDDGGDSYKGWTDSWVSAYASSAQAKTPH